MDCDGVLADFTARTHQDLVALKGEIPPQTHQEWNTEETFGLTKKEKIWIKAQRNAPGWCASIPPYAMALEGLPKLKEVAEVLVVTSPWMSRYWVPERYDWLQNHGRFHHKEVIFTHRKDLVQGDVFVDDKIEHVEAWAKAHPDKTALLFDQPYNQTGWDPKLENVERVGLNGSNPWPKIIQIAAGFKYNW